MRTISIGLALVIAAALIAWAVFTPHEAPAPTPELTAHDDAGAARDRGVEASASTRSAEGQLQIDRAADAAAAPTPAPNNAVPCAERFEPGDIWIRWLDRAGAPCEAPSSMLCGVVPPEEEPKAVDLREGAITRHGVQGAASRAMRGLRREVPDHRSAGEQLWKRSRLDWLDAALQEKSLYLLLDEFAPSGARVELAYDPARTTPLELRLPPHGALRLVVHHGGLPLPPQSKCKLRIRDARGQDSDEERLRCGVIGEELLLERVTLDSELDLLATSFRSQVSERWKIRGPEVDGESTQVVLSIGAHRAVILGCALDDLGAPLAEHLLYAQWISGEASKLPTKLLTLPDGRFLWTPEVDESAPRRGTLQISTNAGLTGTIASVELPAAGVVDVGVVRLVPVGSRFGGRVVDLDGKPCPKAVIHVHCVTREGAPAPVATKAVLRVVHELAESSEPTEAGEASETEEQNFDGASMQRLMQGLAKKSVLHADSHGRFSWDDERAADPQNEFLLIAHHGFQASALRSFRGGDSAIELRIEPLGLLRGRTVFTSPLPIPMKIELRSAASAIPISADLGRSRLAPNGTFRFFNIPAGLYDLELEYETSEGHRAGSGLKVLRDLYVPPGGTCADTRLDPIDLSNAFALFAFELAGVAEHRRNDDDTIWCRTSGATSGAWFRLPVPKSGRHEWVLPRGRYDFTFDLRGLRRVSMLSLSEGRRVECRPAYRARIVRDAVTAEEEAETDRGQGEHASLTYHMDADPPLEIQETHDAEKGLILELGLAGELHITELGPAYFESLEPFQSFRSLDEHDLELIEQARRNHECTVTIEDREGLQTLRVSFPGR